MTVLTWTFDSNNKDQNGGHPFVRMDNGSDATVANGKLTVSTTGYVCNVTDLDFSRKWKIVLAAQDLATTNATPTYFLSIGPVFQSSSIGGALLWRPAGETFARYDDSPCVTDFRRVAQDTNTIYNKGWAPPFEITYDPMSDVRIAAMYQEGIRTSISPLNPKLRDPDTTGRFLYIGQIMDSSATPCAIESITIDDNWDGSTITWAPVAGSHKYWRVRLLGNCTLTECALDTNRSATTDDGVTIRNTSTLSLAEGSTSDSVYRLYDKLYVETFALTSDSTTGWGTIQYTDTIAFDPVQLRIGVKAANTPPTWCELSYSIDGVTWFLEDRFRIDVSQFQTSGARADLVATYQRNATTGRWAYIRSYAPTAAPTFANAKSLSLNGSSQWGTVDMTSWAGWNYTNNYTMSAWIKLASIGRQHTIFYPYAINGSGKANDLLRVIASNQLHFYNDVPVFSSVGSTTLSANVWYHVVCIRESNNSIRLYVNGNLETMTTTGLPGNTTSYSGNVELNVGYSWNRPSTTYNFSGLMDEVSIWNTALTVDQVREIWNGGKPGNLATHSAKDNLQAWWRFEASDGTDSSGKGRNLSLSGGPSFSTDVKT